MATVRDEKNIEGLFMEDRQTFVFNWLSAPFQNKDESKDVDKNARIEDILNELQGSRGNIAMKIRNK